MKSALLTDIGKFSIVDKPMPTPGPDEVLIEVKAVGICGSDVHYYQHGRIGNDRCVFPQSLGHEAAGQVVESGKNTKIDKGLRVAIEPANPCMQCERCKTGYYNQCPNVRFLGSPGMPGAFSEYLVVNHEQCHPIPDSMDFSTAALLEPLGVAWHTIKLSSLIPSDSVAIFGCGPVGLSIAAMAIAAGAGEIFIFDKLQYRLDFAKKHFNIDHVVNVTSNDPVEYIRAATNGRGVDITFEAAGQDSTINWSIEGARIGGRVMIVGIPDVDTIGIKMHPMRRKELSLGNVRRSNLSLNPCIELVKRHRIDVRALATHHFHVDSIKQGFDTSASYADGVMRSMVTFS